MVSLSRGVAVGVVEATCCCLHNGGQTDADVVGAEGCDAGGIVGCLSQVGMPRAVKPAGNGHAGRARAPAFQPRHRTRGRRNHLLPSTTMLIVELPAACPLQLYHGSGLCTRNRMMTGMFFSLFCRLTGLASVSGADLETGRGRGCHHVAEKTNTVEHGLPEQFGHSLRETR